MSAQQIAQQFVQHYYNTFDANRANLAPLYTEQSVLTWETKVVQGGANIVSHLSNLPFQKITRKYTTFDFQPTVNNGLLIVITGDLSIDGGNPMKFTHIFYLIGNGSGGFSLVNEFFRLNIE